MTRSELFARAISPRRADAASQELGQFREFCLQQGLDPSLDAVALYLTHLLDSGESTGARLRVHLARLDLASLVLGQPPPGRSNEIRLFLRGLHREAALPMSTPRVDPLYPAHVRVLVDTAMLPSPGQLRDRAFILCLNATGLHVRHLTPLAWRDVRLRRDRMDLTVHLGSRNATAEHVTLTLFPTDDASCPLAAMRRLREATGAGSGPVFARRGTIGANDRFESLVEPLGSNARVLHERGREWAAPTVVEQVVQRVLLPTPHALRDGALLLIGFLAALTNGEAIALRIGDVRVTDKGLVVSLPYRSRPLVPVPRGREMRYCPVTAWTEWLACLTAAGLDEPERPAFVRTVRHGSIVSSEAFTGGGLGDLVRLLAARAGLEGNYGFTSLRMGFIRTAARERVPAHMVAHQVGLKSLLSVGLHERREHLVTDSIAGVIGL